MISRLVTITLACTWISLVSTGATAQEGSAGDEGRRLFMIHCSACHGRDGDGNGTQPLDPKARNFREGRFQFGNSRTAFFRTISAGLPGRAVMPGFATVLTEEERWQIVDFVQSLLPRRPERESAASRLELRDRPHVVRGLLGPIADGVPERPRGVLLGYPDGKTFEYDVEDVRLLGVRQGGFVDRRDWYGRGGAALRPLGVVVFLEAGGFPGPTFHARTEDGLRALHARLVATDVSGTRVAGSRDLEVDVSSHAASLAAHGRAGLEFVLRDEAGDAVADVYEEPRGIETSVGWGFTRTFEVAGRAAGTSLRLTLLESADDLVVERRERFVAAGVSWIAVRRSEQLVWLLRVAAPDGAATVLEPRALRLDLDTTTAPRVVRFDVVTTIAWRDDLGLLETLERELERRGG